MPNRGRNGSDDELFDTAWIDAMVGDATARIDAEGPVAAPRKPDVVPTPATPAAPADLLGEVSWVEPVAEQSLPLPAAAPPAAAPQPVQSAPVQPTPVHAAPVQPAPVQVQPARVQPTTHEHRDLRPTRAGRKAAVNRQAVITAEVDQLKWQDLERGPNVTAQSGVGQAIDTRQQGSSSSSATAPPSVTRTGVAGLLREWVPVVLGALIVAVILRTFVVQAFEIPSESMLPTLETDDRIVVNQLSYSFGDIQRGEVVVFERPPSLPGGEGDADYLVKRVIGLPGDEVQLYEGDVWVNSERLVEPYVFDESSTRPKNVTIPGCAGGGTADSCVVPEGFVFVLGDNRYNSTDSRVAGPIDSDLIVGRAVLRAWPLFSPRWL